MATTDIAFGRGILSLFGSRVPLGSKIFLLTLAIIDELAAIVIIAVFYAGDLSLTDLGIAAVILGCAAAASRFGTSRFSVYVLIGIAMWVAVIKSGVHATLAGVLIAWCIPKRDPKVESPLKRFETDLHAPFAFAVLPIFAFVNTGRSLTAVGVGDHPYPVTMGVVFGLLLGNPIGVLMFTGAGAALGLTNLPGRSNCRRRPAWRSCAGSALR